jgi:hypothetical protein
MINRVVITDGAKKDLRRVPAAVADKLYAWVAAVSLVGQGKRKGQRAIRLSLLWRAIYTLEKDELKVQFVSVNEVTPHKY